MDSSFTTLYHGQLWYMDFVLVVRLYCWLSTVAILIAWFVPSLQEHFLGYGARAQSLSKHSQRSIRKQPENHLHSLNTLASITVPHSWFTHFYVLSFISSLFWLAQAVHRGWALQFLSKLVHPKSSETEIPRSTLCILLMLFQSIRRLWESHKFSARSKSEMWFGHYVFGLSFYFFTNIAVWIEETHLLLETSLTYFRWKVLFSEKHIVTGLMMFLLSSVAQYLAHAHLASLPKYSVPQHWLFRRMIAPHYLAECIIYIALAMVAAPEQQVFNRSVLSVALLTSINLGITASGTKKWMTIKFHDHRAEIGKRYCLIPGVW